MERLRRGVFRSSSKGMLAALRRLADIEALGVASLDLSALPPRRVIGLATHGLAGKTTSLRRMSREHRLAVLVATISVLRSRATDDVLELFDLLMTTELLSKAERESSNEKLRRYPRVARNAGKLAAAVKVLLALDELDPDTGLGVVWDLIENQHTKNELRAAVATIDELVPPTDAELTGQRMEELAGRFATVRPFLSLMMDTVAFGATGDGTAVLAAMKALARMLVAKSKLPASYLDARQVNHDLITGGWQRLVYPLGRPEVTVDRGAYTLCLLEQFHRHIKHRNIFATGSSRWRDPRAHLLSGSSWDTARRPGMNALRLPEDPAGLLAEHTETLDVAYREVAAGLGGDAPASVDAEGRLHVAALDAVDDPPSLIDLRRRVAALLPLVELPELVLEVMSWQPRFGEAFTHPAGHEPRVADLGLSVAAVLCAHAMNLGFTSVVTPGIEALTRDRIHHVDQNYVRFDTGVEDDPRSH